MAMPVDAEEPGARVTLPRLVNVVKEWELRPEVRDWLLENVGADNYRVVAINAFTSDPKATISFRRMRDAVFFKMRFA
jgi:hypothetical protein